MGHILNPKVYFREIFEKIYKIFKNLTQILQTFLKIGANFWFLVNVWVQFWHVWVSFHFPRGTSLPTKILREMQVQETTIGYTASSIFH